MWFLLQNENHSPFTIQRFDFPARAFTRIWKTMLLLKYNIYNIVNNGMRSILLKDIVLEI